MITASVPVLSGFLSTVAMTIEEFDCQRWSNAKCDNIRVSCTVRIEPERTTKFVGWFWIEAESDFEMVEFYRCAFEKEATEEMANLSHSASISVVSNLHFPSPHVDHSFLYQRGYFPIFDRITTNVSTGTIWRKTSEMIFDHVSVAKWGRQYLTNLQDLWSTSDWITRFTKSESTNLEPFRRHPTKRNRSWCKIDHCLFLRYNLVDCSLLYFQFFAIVSSNLNNR